MSERFLFKIPYKTTTQMKPETIQLDVYNQNQHPAFIDLLSECNEKHTGIIGNQKDLSNKKIVMTRMVMPEGFSRFMFSTFQLCGQKYVYAHFFSFLQFQSNIIDLNFGWDTSYEKLFFEMPHKSNVIFSFFPLDENIQGQEGEKRVIYQPKGLPKYHLAVYVQNKKNYEQKINIAEYIQKDLDCKDFQVKVLANKFPENKPFEYNKLRVFSALKGQLMQNIESSRYQIVLANWISEKQFQSNGIDCLFPEKETISKEFVVTVLPHAEVMYYFL